METFGISELLGSVLILGGGAAAASIVFHALRTGVAPMPSSARARARVLSAVPCETAGAILEIGSGWGTLAFPLADLYPDSPVIGYEISPLPWFVATLRQWLFPRANLTLRREDALEASFPDASVVVCYLGPESVQQLASKLQADATPGTVVVSHTFAIRAWSPLSVDPIGDLYDSRIYAYRVPGDGQRDPAGGTARPRE